MTIKFRVIERAEPGVTGGGTKKFYASAANQGVASLDDITKLIEKISTVSGADIRAVLYAMVDVISAELERGRIVRMGELGSLRVSISSRGKTLYDEVRQSDIIRARILFSPGIMLKKMLATLHYQKV